MSLRVAPMRRDEVERHLGDLAALRIRVFADWPYLYDGDPDYEARYLSTYVDSPDAIVVGAWHGDRLVGASTGTPLEDHADDFAGAFAESGIRIEAVFYCAESVILPEFRGQGAGHTFFDLREAHARALGRDWSSFCAVIRPAGHPARPAGYRALDTFWRGRGYTPLDGAIARFRWRDRGEHEQSEKALQVWIRRLGKESP